MSLALLVDFRNYFFNPAAITPVVVATITFVLGFLVLYMERIRLWRRPFFYVCATLALWLLSHSFLLNALSEEVARVWAVSLVGAMLLTAATLFHFSTVITNKFAIQRHFVLFLYIQAVILLVLCQDCLGLDMPPPIFTVIYVIMIFILSLFNIFQYLIYSQDTTTRRRMKFWLTGYLVLLLAFIDFSVIDRTADYLAGYIAIFSFVLAVASFTLRASFSDVARRAKELETTVGEKERELERVIEELKATQLRLIETGKVSTVASLSAGILHQISQPITAIHGFVRFMKQEMPPTDKFYKPVCLMEEQSVYLKEMLEDLMNLIRHRTIEKSNVDVNAVIERSVNLLVDELRIRRVQWELDCDESLPMVYGDAVHLQQVFMNIIVNAMEALSMLPHGQQRTLQITSRFEQPEQKVILYFKDNGPGIPEEDRRRIFEPFFSTKDKGSGIGLALCKDIVAEHGGTIELDANAGVTFIIKLPVQ